jgi:hypothetical protein
LSCMSGDLGTGCRKLNTCHPLEGSETILVNTEKHKTKLILTERQEYSEFYEGSNVRFH